MAASITFAEVDKAVRSAFKGVRKGGGIGVREAIAMDDWADAEERMKARQQDIEESWTDIAEEWVSEIGTALSYTDPEGFKFLLPAAILSNYGDNLRSVFFRLCLTGRTIDRPHHGFPEYTHYLKSIHPKAIAEAYSFTTGQIHAIALFFKWYMQDKKDHLYCNREQKIESLQRANEDYRKHVSPDHYKLSLQDEISNFDEECRILKDWLDLGGVPV